jgi:predicted AlkP superfamily phosphohydrolase/phosphomutase
VEGQTPEGTLGNDGPRLLVIGIDSSTFRIIKPLVDAGDLPTFRDLLERGSHGVLLSTLPSVTPPGWVTSYTGVNPGKHNIYDFKDHTTYLDGELPYEMASVTSRHLRADPFWRILNGNDLRTGLVNLPLTYPVEEVMGYLLAGFPCGDDDEGLFHPLDLKREVQEAVDDYVTYLKPEDMDQGRPAKYLELVNRAVQDQATAALHLMVTRPTDLVMFVFTEVDRIQHYFWNCWDEDHPTHSAEKARFRHAFRDHYRLIDRNIRAMMEAAGSDVPVMVYSDHGSNTLTRHIFLNTFFAKERIIVMRGGGSEDGPSDGKGGSGEGKGPRLGEAILDRRRIERLFKRLHIEGLIHKIPKSLRRMLPTVSFETVDWGRSKAYFSSQGGQSVTINVRGREPEGWVEPGEHYEAVVEEVISVLKKLRDPQTGASPFRAIYRRSQLYEGPYVDNGPDIVLHLAEGYIPFRDIKEEVFYDVGPKWSDRSSEHEREGILLMAGPDVRSGHKLGDKDLVDIAPTILHLCGLPVPRYMDGKVIEEAFSEQWLRDHPVRLEGSETFEGREGEGSGMTPQEEEQLKDRLRSLGYMG